MKNKDKQLLEDFMTFLQRNRALADNRMTNLQISDLIDGFLVSGHYFEKLDDAISAFSPNVKLEGNKWELK